MKTSLMLIITVFIFGCAMPVTSVRTVDDRPSLAIKGAPQGALLFVDEVLVGAADIYNGQPNVLRIESGTHHVKVTIQDTTLYEQDIFADSELKTITVR